MTNQTPTPEQTLSFEDWCAELNKLPNAFGIEHLTDDTGVDCWRCYYDDGYTPEDVLAEDESHAD